MTKRSIGIRLAALALAAAGVLVAAGGLDPGARLAAQGAPASPDLRRVPQSREQIVHSFAPVVRKVAPAVINVYALRV